MATSFKIPKNNDSELYYDPNELKVGFRTKISKTPGVYQQTVLRVVVQVFGNVVEDRFFNKNTKIEFGSSRKKSIPVSLIGLADPFTLLDYQSSGNIHIMLSDQFTGVVQFKDKLLSLDELKAQFSGTTNGIPLPAGSRGCIENEHILVYFEEISDPEKLPPAPIFKSLSDPYLMKWIAFSIALHLMLLLFLRFAPAEWLSFGKPPVVTDAEKGIEVKIDPKKFPPFVPKTMLGQMSRGQQGKEGEGERAAGQEGRRGAGKPGRTGGSGKISKKDIGRSGVLDFFNKGSSTGAFSDLLGEGSGIAGAVSNLGMAPGEAGIQGETNKRFGKGLQGTGTGGGGRTASIGEGLGTKGRGAGQTGSGLADFGSGRDNVRVSAQIPDDEVVIAGTLSKEEVERVINNKMGQIKYCYEKELVKNPKLGGKIVTNFIIGLQGSVTRSSISTSTMANPVVESCISSVMRSLKFPKPGGGTVEVFFPFMFRVAG